MKTAVLSQFDMSILPITTMILFMSLFFGVIYWLFRQESKEIYSEAKNMPLNDGTKLNQ